MDENNCVKTKKRKRGGVIPAIAAVIVLFIGLCLLLYPSVADYVNSLAYRRDIEEYERQLNQVDESEREAMLELARDYNARLLERSDRISALDMDWRAEYNTLLDPFGSGMMGYIEIAQLRIFLPIYHGTDETVLRSGVGHIEGSSLPVGGAGVHTILSGHTGLPSAKLFSSIDRLGIGDTFKLHILGETLLYRVVSKATVLPEEVGELRIAPNSDICTLMTCTPYGINTHRLLIRGERVIDSGGSATAGGSAADGGAGNVDGVGAGNGGSAGNSGAGENAGVPETELPIFPIAAAALVFIIAVLVVIVLLKRKKN